MNIIKSLTNLLQKNKSFDPEDAPDGFCPNCWGREEYGGNFYEAIKNENVDIKTLSSNKGWVQRYADKNLGTIQLKYGEDNEAVCQRCKISYHQIE